MFQHASFSAPVRAPATLLVVATNAVLGPVYDQDTGAITFVLETTGRTVGSYTAQVEGSIDGLSTTYYSLGAAMLKTVLLDGYKYIQLSGAVPKYVRVVLTPAGGFDGRVAVIARSAGRLTAATAIG